MLDMETKKQTNVELRQFEASRLKAVIIDTLKITELEFCEYQFEMGLAYLREICPDDKGELRYSKLFWQWFKNHWTQTDEVFVTTLKWKKFSLASLRALYNSFHDPVIMARELKQHVNVFIEKEVWVKIHDAETTI